MFKHILVATDGSALADKSLSCAVALGRQCGAMLTVLMVVPDYTAAEYASVVVKDGDSAGELRQRLATEGRKRLDAVLKQQDLTGATLDRQLEVADDPHERILKCATQQQCDLIVMASRGRSALKSALLGSQTLHVLTGAQVPVMVVR